MELALWARSCFRPTVLASASGDAKQALERIQEGLSPAAMLQPFAVAQEPIRFLSLEASISIPAMELSVVDESACQQQSAKELDCAMHSVCLSGEDGSAVFDRFWETLQEGLRFNYTDALDHPLIHTLIVSIENIAASVSFCEAQTAGKSLPSLFTDSVYNPSLLYFMCIIVYDHTTSPTQRDFDHARDKLQQALPAGRSDILFLRLNGPGPACPYFSCSSPPSSPGRRFQAHIDSNDPLQSLSSHHASSKVYQEPHVLSQEDADEMYLRLWKSISGKTLPFLRRKMLAMKEEIAKGRAGLRNQIKLFFGRPSRSVTALPRSNAVPYPYDTVEAQIRFIANTALTLQDYAVASEYYRMAISEFKGEHTKAYYGSACLLYAISIAITASRKEKKVEEYLNSAVQAFIGCQRTSDALNASLWAVVYYTSQGSSHRAGSVMLYMSKFCKGLWSAVCTEKAALDFGAQASYVRRSGYHAITAAHRYQELERDQEAIRCFQMGLASYCDGWSYALDHIHIALGRLYEKHGDYALAAAAFYDPVSSGRATPEHQKLYLDELIQIASALTEMEHPVPLPVLDASSIHLLFSDRDTLPSSIGATVWRSCLDPHRTRLAGQKLVDLAKYAVTQDTSQVLVAYEQRNIAFELRNPLDIPLPLARVTLDVDMECPDTVICSVQNVTLRPKETRLIEVKVQCTSPGTLTIHGASWYLFDSLRVVSRWSETHLATSIPVVSHLPMLSFTMPELPYRSFHGEYIESSIRVTNSGTVPITRLELITSHRPMMTFTMVDGQYATGTSVLPLDLSSYTPLQPGEDAAIPIVFHAQATGEHLIEFLFSFSSEDGTEFVCYKAAPFIVFPALTVCTSCRRHPTVDGAYAATIELKNELDTGAYITGIFGIGSMVEITPAPSFYVAAGSKYVHTAVLTSPASSHHVCVVGELTSWFSITETFLPPTRDPGCIDWVICYQLDHEEQTLGELFVLNQPSQLLTPTQSCPMNISYTFSERVVHDFSSCPLSIPVTIELENLSNNALSISVIGLEPYEYFDSSNRGVDCREVTYSDVAVWDGKRAFKITVPPRSGSKAELTALIFEQGWYNISRVRFVVHHESRDRTFYFPQLHLLEAQHASK